MRVILHRLGDRAVGLRERPRECLGRLGQRTRNRLHQERVRVGPERERAGLAAGAHHAARAGREAAQVLCLATRCAGGKLRRKAGREQQLQAKGERLGPARLLRPRVEQSQFVAEQVVGRRVWVGGVEQPQHRLAGLGAAL